MERTRCVFYEESSTADLRITLHDLLVGRGVVKSEPGVAEQVGDLPGVGHHAHPELAKGEQGLNAAQSRESRPPKGRRRSPRP